MPAPVRAASLLGAALVFAAIAMPGGAAEIELPAREEIEAAIPEGGSLSGREIFDRFLDNRLHSAVQWQTVVSRDPGGNEQRSRFWVRWKDYRDSEKKSHDGVVAKTLVKFSDPEDMRQTGFLMVVNKDRSNDQFIWSPATGRVRRVRLSGVGIMGTDYTFDDIGWKSIEDAEYQRLPDAEVDGVRAYVLEVTMKPFVDSEYQTMRTWIDQEHYIPLRTIYRDQNGVPMREMVAESGSIENFEGAWIATRSVMYNLKERTSTSVYVEALDPDVTLADQAFSTFQLTRRH
ncbi:MAG: outer membrane lipoprotein-sorting protein [Deltaproteobacteria bacterium]|nr:outer membrane lipoprotein-sorting protein [Deltaproteobacteria bacterium]